ncbi:hypothetical protein [Arenimonas caeni]|jgi:hypothetical protein|uniref:hypothetical protein n=1 Tax=Arenimonas caeni TaxID=2058085 RepID=UPI000E0925E7|nr:hypothetical protein [Arenimonas caeni]MDY0021725.1 hypothetical protein [Arenimonas caeni]
MHRFLLASCLALLAGGAIASEAVPADAAAGSCTKAAAEATEKPGSRPSDEPAATPGATAPVRPRGAVPGRSTPRWNSLLPGMIR